MSCSLIPATTVQDGPVTENPDGSDFERSFKSGRCAVRVDDKFSANFAAKMDEGELNTIASELKLLRLVIEIEG